MSIPPIRINELPEGWIEARRVIILRDGYAVRGGADNTIEVKSLRTNEWLRLQLANGAMSFESEAERDRALSLLTAPNASGPTA